MCTYKSKQEDGWYKFGGRLGLSIVVFFAGGGKSKYSEAHVVAAAAVTAAASCIGDEHEGVGHDPNPRARMLLRFSSLPAARNGPASPGQVRARAGARRDGVTEAERS